MNIQQEPQGDPAESHPQPRAEAPAPPRHTDWISYAVAQSHQAQAEGNEYSTDSKF